MLDRRPRELSGGERQRASMARALLSDPLALLMDEPLAHLDPALRRTVRDEVVGLRERFPGPIVYVTHDHAEAMSVGDQLAVLIDGRIEDAGDPAGVYDSPRTIGVARFLGDRPMNVLDGDPLLGIRPEHVRVVADAELRGHVTRREPTGADAYVVVETPRGDDYRARSGKARGARRRRRGSGAAGGVRAPVRSRIWRRAAMNELDALARGVVLAGFEGETFDPGPAAVRRILAFRTQCVVAAAGPHAHRRAARAHVRRRYGAVDSDRPGGRTRSCVCVTASSRCLR